MKLLSIFILIISFSHALLITPEEAMMQTFSTRDIVKKSMILTNEEVKKVQQAAQTKLDSKLFRLYTAKKGGQTIGFGILLSQKVRSKNTAVLYILDPKGKVQNIEIIAFNEPMQYRPSKRWMEQFTKKETDRFELSNNIVSISGATLSANALIRAANIAQNIWKVKLNQ